jgi:hypothetical protein
MVILLLLSFGNRDTRSYLEADIHIENYKKMERTTEDTICILTSSIDSVW